MGWDNNCLSAGFTGNDFNPPIPCGMGPFDAIKTPAKHKISIHPSRVGWDSKDNQVKIANICISIHPSRVGWDILYIQPTIDDAKFQSTHPVWDGTLPFFQILIGSVFQSTHPVWDGTSLSRFCNTQTTYFNPPIPCGMGLWINKL